MNASPRYATLHDYLRVVRGHRVLIVLVTLAFGAAAFALSTRSPRVYEAEASMSVADVSVDAGTFGQIALPTLSPEAHAAQAANLVTTMETAASVRRRLRLRESPGAIGSRIRGQAEVRTNLVVITARDSSPGAAVRLADGFAEVVTERVNRDTRNRYAEAARLLRRELRGSTRLERERSRAGEFTPQALQRQQLARLESLARFVEPTSVTERATASSQPVSPKPIRDTLIAVLLGLTVGLIGAFLRDTLDRRFRNAHEIRDELGLPLVGHVGEQVLGRSIASSNGRAPLADEDLEGFRIIRTNIEYLDVDNPPRTLLVTSATAEEGKSTVAISLAATFAAAGRRVLLVEGDMRRPVFAKRLGIKPEPGLSDYLAGTAEPREIVQLVPLPTVEPSPNDADGQQLLAAITAGRQTPRPTELLGSQRFAEFLEQVSEAYDNVIVDSCPLLPVGDTLELVPHVASVVMCVRARRTTRDGGRAAREALAHFPARPTGIVVTGVKPGHEDDYGYYTYAYGYSSKR